MTKKAFMVFDLFMRADRETPGTDRHADLVKVLDQTQAKMNAEDRLTFAEWRDKYLASRPRV